MTQDALFPKNTRAAIVAAICLLILGGLADRSLRSWRNVWGATYTPLASPLSELPERIGSYVSERDLPLDPAILDVAKVDAFVNRSYVDHARSKRITLYVGYWGRANVGMGHGPDVCYRAVGWNAEAEPHERVVPFLTSEMEPARRQSHFIGSRTPVPEESNVSPWRLPQRLMVDFKAHHAGSFGIDPLPFAVGRDHRSWPTCR
jgi:hypothetical protein